MGQPNTQNVLGLADEATKKPCKVFTKLYKADFFMQNIYSLLGWWRGFYRSGFG